MRAAWAAGFIALCVTAALCSPAHYWLDSGELAAAGYELGVMHPPGAPGFGLLLRAAAAIPVGPVGFRLALVSGVLFAATVAMVFVLVRRHRGHPLLAWGTCAWLLCGLTVLRQARVVEIYTLGALLTVVTLWGLDPVSGSRPGRRPGDTPIGPRLIAVMAATWAAWCFGDLRLSLGPLIAVAWIGALRRREPWAGWAPLCAVAATAVVIALPLASARAPAADWGDADSLARLWAHLGAHSIRASFADEILPASASLWAHNLGAALRRLAEDLGPAGPVLVVIAAVGLVAARRPVRDRPRAAALGWVAASQLFYAVGVNPMGGADRQTGIVLGLTSILIVVLALQRWMDRVPRLVPMVVPLVFGVGVISAGLGSIPDATATRSWAPHLWTTRALDQLPPRALLLTQSDDLAAGTLFATVVEGARPDVVALPAQHLYRPEPDAARDDPVRHPLWLAAATGPGETERIAAVIAGHRGPVALESAAAGLFAGLPWWSDTGAAPLRLGAVPPRPADPIEVQIDRWLPHLPAAVDRERLAVAIAQWARARVRVQGDLDGARAALTVSLRDVWPDHPSALVTLGSIADRMGDRPAAIAATRRALALQPDRTAALLNLALYLSRDPRGADEAAALATRAASLRPWRRDVWAKVANIRTQLGDEEGARQARQRAQAPPEP